jgi:hypothetical protein
LFFPVPWLPNNKKARSHPESHSLNFIWTHFFLPSNTYSGRKSAKMKLGIVHVVVDCWFSFLKAKQRVQQNICSRFFRVYFKENLGDDLLFLVQWRCSKRWSSNRQIHIFAPSKIPLRQEPKPNEAACCTSRFFSGTYFYGCWPSFCALSIVPALLTPPMIGKKL